MRTSALQTERQARTAEQPTLRKTEKVDALLRAIGEDARSLAERYPQETVVPEGGE